MFTVKGKAEIKSINCRTEFHGDETVPAITIRFAAADADASGMDSAIPGASSRLWAKDGQPQLQECYPLRVRHKIENCHAKIKVGKRSIELNGCDVTRIDVTPLHGARAQVILNVSAAVVIDPLLHRALRSEVEIEIIERQLALGDMEQRAAAGNGADHAAAAREPQRKKKTGKKSSKKTATKKAKKTTAKGAAKGTSKKRPKKAAAPAASESQTSHTIN